MASAPVPSANVVTTGNPYSVVFRLAMPTVFAMLSQSVVNEIDIYFFSRLPCPESSTAQAALLPCLIILWAFGGSISAISVGTQALTARRFAEGDRDRAGSVLFNSFTFSALVSIAFTIFGYACKPWLLSKLISLPDVRVAADSYLNYRLLGISSMVLTFSFKSFFDGIGKTSVHMWSALVMNAINIVLCAVLIFGSFGAPRMGMAGAGVAALVSTWVGLAIVAVWAALPSYRKGFRPFAPSKWEPKLVRELLRLSVPSGVATLAVMSGFALFAMIVSLLDSRSTVVVVEASGCAIAGHREAVSSAATTLIVGILKLTFTACLAFGTATATLVGQSLGEGDPDKAQRFGWTSVRLGLLVFGVVGFLEGILFPEQILGFLSNSQQVRDAALGPMRLMGICTPLIAVGMILTQALFGAGNSFFVMVVELILHFTCLVPLAYILGISAGFGLMGIWSAAAVYVVLLTIVMTWKFARGDWKHIRL